MELRFARPATRHRITRASTRFVIEHAGMWISLPPPPNSINRLDERLVFLGDDQNGRALEVMAVRAGDDDLLVIHAMELRPRFRDEYTELKKWQI